MLQKIDVIGTALFNYIILSILLNIGVILILPFIPIVVGISAYHIEHKDNQSLRTIGSSINENRTLIFQFSLFIIAVVTVSITNILVFDTGYTVLETIIDFISYLLLFVAILLVLHGPVLIIEMKLTFKELLFNSIMLPFGGLIAFFTNIGIVLLFGYLTTQSILYFIFGISFVIQAITRFSYQNLIKLKETMQ